MGEKRQMALITDNFKIIFRTNGESYELFRMDIDPTEKTDVFFTRPKKLKEL